MEKIKFVDPDTQEEIEFAVEEETQLNGIRYLLVSEGQESGDCEAYILKEVSTDEEETTLNGTRYLLVSEGEESGDCEAYILKEVSTKDEEVLYQMVEDDVEFSAIAKVFSELTDDDTALEY